MLKFLGYFHSNCLTHHQNTQKSRCLTSFPSKTVGKLSDTRFDQISSSLFICFSWTCLSIDSAFPTSLSVYHFSSFYFSSILQFPQFGSHHLRIIFNFFILSLVLNQIEVSLISFDFDLAIKVIELKLRDVILLILDFRFIVDFSSCFIVQGCLSI